MNTILLNKLRNDMDKKIKEIGGFEKFNKSESANEILTGWINDLVSILDFQKNENCFETKIDYTNYINCYFKVSFYESNFKAMCITLYGVKENELDSSCYPICNCTVFHSSVDYKQNIIAIKEEYINLFKKLQIIDKVKSTNTIPLSKCKNGLDYADKPFCICEINQEKLKRFCKDWNYKYE